MKALKVIIAVLVIAFLLSRLGGKHNAPAAPTAPAAAKCVPHVDSASDHEQPSPAVQHAAERCHEAISPRATVVKILDWSRDNIPNTWTVFLELNTGNELMCVVPDDDNVPIDRQYTDVSTPMPECKP